MRRGPATPKLRAKGGFAPIFILVIVAVSVTGAVLYQQFTSKTQPQPRSPSPSISDASPATNGDEDTTNWKTFDGEQVHYEGTEAQGKSTFYTIQYPAKWENRDSLFYKSSAILYPLGKQPGPCGITQVVLGGLGRGGPVFQELRRYASGNAYYYFGDEAGSGCIHAYGLFSKGGPFDYTFEINNLPKQYSDEYNTLFDQMLTSFKVITQ